MEENRKVSSLNREIIINNAIKGRILDINELGVLVHAPADFLPGSILELSFIIDERQISVTGAIQQIKPGAGVEIEFLNLSPTHRSWIKTFLDAQAEVSAKKSAQRRILLVDDSRQLRSAYGGELLGEGFTVTEAQSGTEAFVRLQEANFDLVILDLGIEGIDGFKVLHIIRSKPALKEIPVIILSARSNPADIEKAMALGATDYLVKTTITPVQLAEKVKKSFSQKEDPH